MKFLVIAALAAVLPLQATTASATDTASSAVAGQKLDSGLGELPHYRLWADPSGKHPMGKPMAAKAEKATEQAPRSAAAKAVGQASTQIAGMK